MEEERTLLVGLDLCDDYTQLTCYNKLILEPESIGWEEKSEQFLIPTVIGIKSSGTEWVYGKEAEQINSENKGEAARNLISLIKESKKVSLWGREFAPEILLEKYFRKVFALLHREYPDKTIRRLVITVETLEPVLVKGIMEALKPLKLYQDRVSLQSHGSSFLYYVINQKKELWLNDVGLFDFRADGLQYCQLTMERRKEPQTAILTFRDFRDTLNMEMITKKNRENAATVFENIAHMVIDKQILSSLYITGIGFEDDWADEALKGLCTGRRVFKGQNLYAKGACYSAKALTEGTYGKYAMIGDEMLAANIMIQAYTDGKIQDISLARAAVPWYEIDNHFDFILYETNEVEIKIKDTGGNLLEDRILSLSGIQERMPGMTRIEIRVKMKDVRCLVITITDLGFGEFVQSSGRSWEEIITF